MIPDRWQNQQEALEFALGRPACMLDMEMGTGKTRVAIDAVMERADVRRVLVVCPKAVIPVWGYQLGQYASKPFRALSRASKETMAVFARRVAKEVSEIPPEASERLFVIVNYESVWRKPLGDWLLGAGLDMVILDESHRAKSAGSKVSKYLAMLAKRVKYRMCLSGTPMANSPLDVYGQYRFLDRSIFGTNHQNFMQEYAIMGGPEKNFVVGFKNQKRLMEKFQSIAYTCRMADVADRVKLPDALPPAKILVELPARDMKTMREFGREFVAACGGGFVTASNILVKMLRMQQIAAGFCTVQDGPLGEEHTTELNNSKMDALTSILLDLASESKCVVFCVFQHDLDAIHRAAAVAGRCSFELSGRANTLEEWKAAEGAVIAVQIQAGAEGVDMTGAHHAVYFSLPHSLALYDQSRARLYRPGQTAPVSFMHLVATDTIDESMYNSLIMKRDIITSIKEGTFDFGYMRQ